MILYTDGGRKPSIGAYGSWALFLESGEGHPDQKQQCIAFHDKELYPDIATNNEAEYTAIIKGLEYCISKEYKNVRLYSDSKLVINQIQGNWKINYDHLRVLAEKVRELMENFDIIVLHNVKRDIIVSKLGH